MLGRVFSLSFHAERRDIYMYGGDEKDRNRSFYLGNQSKKKKPETRTRNFRKNRKNKVMIA